MNRFNRLFRLIAIVAVILGLAAGTVLAASQITRDVPASLNVQLRADEGIALFSDVELTEPITALTFTAQIDQFDTTLVGDTSIIYVRNDTLSNFDLTVTDDLAQGDIVIVSPLSTLAPGESAMVELGLEVTGLLVSGDVTFTVTFTATNPDAVARLLLSDDALTLGESTLVTLSLTRADNGLSGYVIVLEYDTAQLAIESVSFPSLGIYRYLQDDKLISATDVNNVFGFGSTHVVLAQMSLRPLTTGEVRLGFETVRIDDDTGSDLPVLSFTHTFVV